MVSSVSALTAASVRVSPERWGKVTKPPADRGKWQAEAWDMLDHIGELSFALLWKTALLSRFRLVASDIDPDTGRPTGITDNQAAKDIVARIAGGVAGQAQMLSRLAPLMMIPGEGWLAIIYPDGDEQWHVLSGDEIRSRGDQVELTLDDGTKYTMDKAVDTLSRIWRPDPRISSLAWSPVKAALPILRRILRMEQNIEAAGKSRQAGNGILVLPREISMPVTAPPTGTPDPDAPTLPPPPPPPSRFVSADEVRKALQEAMSTAIQNPASAEALVPIVLTVAGEYVDKIRHIKFDSEVSEKAQAAQEKAIRRLAMTLDMPPEVLLGLADLNHWSLWGVEEEAVRWHAAPEMETICAALTEQLLTPMLPPDLAGKVVIWYDASDVEAEPDQLDKVSTAYKDGVVNAEAYIRELGLSVDQDGYDLTTEAGWALWAVDQVRRTPQLLPQLLPVLRMLVPALAGLPDLPAAAPPPPPSGGQPETIDAPAIPDTRDNAARAVVRLCVNEALRRAGARRRGRSDHARLREVSAVDVHRVLGPCAESEVERLIDGWEELADDQVCAEAGIDRTRLRQIVYTIAAVALTTAREPVVPAQLAAGARP
ncbi:hypothetical protein NDR87_31525 [Nocardia sp. CDC159]|uniref:Portal protein n=1 Tax=Nocardia pulmonis TaxID=2951408 RepID=A0A9X2ECG4_9NOCA|nr:MULTISPECIES: hypothetical protein [Nocardia]MCM6777919.1 hypothetical protein [Nocardia pulmonis]MCM6790910.1 hypothetical protein [Nocardia sp. CDC159]